MIAEGLPSVETNKSDRARYLLDVKFNLPKRACPKLKRNKIILNIH